jgi:hypothetical protein
MTKYEYYKLQIKEYEEKAKKTTDGNLKTFYTNAAEGFKEHLEKLTVITAGENA